MKPKVKYVRLLLFSKSGLWYLRLIFLEMSQKQELVLWSLESAFTAEIIVYSLMLCCKCITSFKTLYRADYYIFLVCNLFKLYKGLTFNQGHGCFESQRDTDGCSWASPLQAQEVKLLFHFCIIHV